MHLISRGRLLNGILLWVWHIFYACANPLTLLIFSLRATCWNHDGTERVLGSKSLENELLWTSINVLVVSPVVQIKGSIIVCATNNFNVKLPINICASLNKCSTFVQETPVIHLQQSRITPLRSFPAYRPIARDVIIEFYCSIRKINAHAWRTTRILSMAKCTEVVFAASLSTNEGSAHLRLTVC